MRFPNSAAILPFQKVVFHLSKLLLQVWPIFPFLTDFSLAHLFANISMLFPLIRSGKDHSGQSMAGFKNICRFSQPSPNSLEKRSTIIGRSIGFIIFYAAGGIDLT